MISGLITRWLGFPRKKEEPTTNLIKFYIALDEQSFGSHLDHVAVLYEKLSGGRRGKYYLNYSRSGKAFTRAGFTKAMSSRTPETLELLSIYSENNDAEGQAVTVSLSSMEHLDGGVYIYELVCAWPVAEDLRGRLVDFSRELARRKGLLYGYGRTLPASLTITENRIKKTLFGSSVKFDPLVNAWLENSPADGCLLKGFYRFNLVRKDRLGADLFARRLGQGLGRATDVDGNFAILEFDENELQQIKTVNPDIAGFVRG